LKRAEKTILDLGLVDAETLQCWKKEAAMQVEEAVATAQKEPVPDGATEDWCAISTRELIDRIG
jgi:TPP-dependent pyruvate/acetoin dehydrogenase alpha subunit